MNEEHLFRTTLIVILVALFPFALYHRVKSQATGEPLDRRQEGIFILATLRPVGLSMLIGIIVYLVDPTRMSWSSVPLPAWVRWGGIGITIVAAVLLMWTFRRLGTNITDTVVTRRKHTLVMRRSGPMGPASVLRRRRPADARHLACRRELALSDHGCRVVRAVRYPHADRGGQSAGAVRRQLSRVHGQHWSVSAEARNPPKPTVNDIA